jgi:hypothetical protein
MRQEHRAGEKSFVDYSGDGLEVHDLVSGEVRVARLFLAMLGASNLTYAEPVFGEDVATWVSCHVNAFTWFSGVKAAGCSAWKWRESNPPPGTGSHTVQPTRTGAAHCARRLPAMVQREAALNASRRSSFVVDHHPSSETHGCYRRALLLQGGIPA